MYAIVEIAGQQFKIKKDQTIYTHHLGGEEGSEISFDKVMLIANDDSITVGTPTVAGTSVKAKIINHLQGDKVIVFKKKRRKGYQVKNGHRQALSKIQISEIA